jgi:pilus assembly protein CpaE
MASEQKAIRVMIADGSHEGRERLREIFGDMENGEMVGIARDGQEAAQMALQLRPDVLLVNEALGVMDGLRVAELVNLGAPEVKTIVIGDAPSRETLHRAMRSGAREFLVEPLRPEQLIATVAEVAALDDVRGIPEYLAVADPDKIPRVIVVTGAKGGIGKSTIATNLAVGLQKRTGDKVAILDLYTQFGDVSTMLNIIPTRTVIDLVPMTGELDIQLLEDHMVEHESGVKVLIGSVDPVALEAIPIPTIEAILNILRLHYRFVVIDMPPFLHSTHLHVLTYCSMLLLVANLFDVTTVSDAKKFFQAVEGRYVAKEKIHLVLNRSSRFNRLVAADVVRALDHPVAAEIPNDSRLVYAVNQGVPIVMSRPNSPVGQSFQQLADSVASNGSNGSNGKQHTNGSKKKK